MRAPVDTIAAPMFPAQLEWVNVASLRMDKQRGRPVLVDFWDFCRVHSLRVLPQIKAWHERYEAAGLRVISVHAGAYPPSRDHDEIRAAVARLGIEHPVLLDTDFALWKLYANEGWPARYLFNPELRLHAYHYGEGGVAETEAEIAALLDVAPAPTPSEPGRLMIPTPEQQGTWSGAYAAGSVHAVLEGTGSVRINGRELAVTHAGCHPLVEHAHHTEATLELEIGTGVTCHAVQFTAGPPG